MIKMKKNLLKKELILNAAEDIVKYADDKHCIDMDVYDIAELININLGFIFHVIHDTELNEIDEDDRYE
jgi:hypothetical protein